jgi:hypothetical protein
MTEKEKQVEETKVNGLLGEETQANSEGQMNPSGKVPENSGSQAKANSEVNARTEEIEKQRQAKEELERKVMERMKAEGLYDPDIDETTRNMCAGMIAEELEPSTSPVDPSVKAWIDSIPYKHGIPCLEVYQKFVKWCEERGYRPCNMSELGKELKRVFPSVRKVTARINGKYVQVYKGLYRKIFLPKQ